MLQTTRNITTRLAFLNLPKSSDGLLRSFSTTATLARVSKLQYADEDARKAAYKYQSEYHLARYHNDPVYQAKQLARRRAHYDGRKNEAHVRLYDDLRRWVRTCKWVRGEMQWKTHVPVWHESRVEHYCHGCEWTRKCGTKLWWRKRDAAGVLSNAGKREILGKSD